MDVTKLTIKGAIQSLKKKEYSSKELVQGCLDQIKRHDATLHVFLTVDEKTDATIKSVS